MKVTNRKLLALSITLLAFLGYSLFNASYKKDTVKAQEAITAANEITETSSETAVFAGGCFWLMEEVFEKLDGVLAVESGYTGGHKENPTYEEVGSGTTGHLESVEVRYNPNQISYDNLLQVFWRNVDPTDAEGQFANRGREYQSAIFYKNEEQKALAEASRNAIVTSGRFNKPIVTRIEPAAAFYKAEEEHQNFFKKNPIAFKLNLLGSGRDPSLDKIWGKDREVNMHQDFDKEEKLKTLTKLQYEVTQYGRDEEPFNNEYWDNDEQGIYVDIVSGEPLFSSKDKFDAGVGWPNFTKPLELNNVIVENSAGFVSVAPEVRSRKADSFLGHKFKNGPQPTGVRYCMNSAALKFIPVHELEEQGYGSYAKLFDEQS